MTVDTSVMRKFNMSYVRRVGALEDSFLGSGLPYGTARILYEIGLGARTGREVFRFPRGSFNPVISDGRTIFLTGYSSLYALRPKKG